MAADQLSSGSSRLKRRLAGNIARPTLLLLLSGALAAQEAPLFRSDANFVSVDVQVLSDTKPVLGLQPEDFVIEDNGQRRPVSTFATEKLPLDIVLLVDVSASTEHIQQMIKTYAAEAFHHLDENDRVALFTFATQPQIIAPLTLDRSEAVRKLRLINPPNGGTEINATLLSTAVVLAQSARLGVRRSIVMLTDNCAERDVPDAEVREELLRENIVVNGMLFPAPCSGKGADLNRFTAATGGEVLNVDEEFPLAEMFQRMRQRYVLLYSAPGGEPGSFRRIKVDLSQVARAKLRSVSIRAREGYVVSAPLKPGGGVDPRVGK